MQRELPNMTLFKGMLRVPLDMAYMKDAEGAPEHGTV
jgi:hypothetical protein